MGWERNSRRRRRLRFWNNEMPGVPSRMLQVGRGCVWGVIPHAADFQYLCISSICANDKECFWAGLAN